MVKRLKYYFWRCMPTSRILNLKPGVQISTKARLLGWPIIENRNGGSIHVGENVTLNSRKWGNALGVLSPVIIRTLSSAAKVEIGNNSGLSGTRIASAQQIKIGERVLIGADTVIVDNNFHPINPVNRYRQPRPASKTGDAVIIEDDVFIGTGCIILKGVTIGRGSVIGAHSVVSKSIPEMVIASGNPAVVLQNIQVEQEKTQ